MQLSNKVIDLDELRVIAAQGVPDVAGVGSTVWKLLACYWAIFPMIVHCGSRSWQRIDHNLQPSKTSSLATLYVEIAWREEPEGHSNENAEHGENGLLHRSEVTQEEHPFSLGKTSAWNQFFEYSEIMGQIDRDVKRTHPDMHFFCGDSSFAKSNQESLKNVLIIFAKLNAGIRYVQGMN